MPQAVRVRTSAGWQDLVVQGAPGGALVFEQPGDPGAQPSGSIWIDTDEVPPSVWAPPALVTSLPASPTDGLEVYYLADATSGIIWHLRYRAASASAYKWEVLGGTKFYAQNTAGQNITSATPVAVPPSMTLPLAGDYDFAWGGRIYNQNVQGGNAQMWLGIAGVNQTPIADWYQGTAGAATTLAAGNPVQTKRATVAAGNVIDMRLSANNGTATSDNRWIEAMPVRVG